MENEVYKILEEKGQGATSYVFKVKEIKTEKIYAAKIYKESNKYCENEKEFLKKVKQKNSPYIINLINDGTGKIIRDNEPIQAKQHLILEYAPKGDLLSYIWFTKTGFGEEYGKLLFNKILQGVQACHEEGICHRDIKAQNILVDENDKIWNPKVCDFGFAAINTGKLKENCGTFNYMAPEIFEKKCYDGFKADIFSLGVVLFTLVTGVYGFKYEKKKKNYEKLYDLIKLGYTDVYWTLLESWEKIKNLKLSDNFKNLYIKMVSYNDQERPSIQDILNNDWLKDIRDLKQDESDKLEKSLREEFVKRENIINELKTKNVEIVKKDDNINIEGNRSFDDDKIYFDPEIKPTEAKHGIYMDTYIKINGSLNPNKFMNKLVNRIDEKLGDNCSIDCEEDDLKFDITFKEEEEEQEQEKIAIPKDIEEKLAKLNLGKDIEKDIDIDDFNNEQCILEVQLFKSTDNSHLLRFAKKSGQLDEFYKNMKKISEIAEDIL